jgi:hypothetical protein
LECLFSSLCESIYDLINTLDLINLLLTVQSLERWRIIDWWSESALLLTSLIFSLIRSLIVLIFEPSLGFTWEQV